MKIIYNNIIPFGNFSAINLFGVIFIRRGKYITKGLINHELIHTRQMRELWFFGFYLWYFFEWFVNLFIYGFNKKAYYNICFEKEAYIFQNDLNYLKSRVKFSWIKFL